MRIRYATSILGLRLIDWQNEDIVGFGVVSFEAIAEKKPDNFGVVKNNG